MMVAPVQVLWSAALARGSGATPRVRSHSPSGTSNASIGSHMNDASGWPSQPASCKGKPITSRSDAANPSIASAAGIVRPRRRRYVKAVLPTAKNVAVRAVSALPRFLDAPLDQRVCCRLFRFGDQPGLPIWSRRCRSSLMAAVGANWQARFPKPFAALAFPQRRCKSANTVAHM